MDNGWMQTVTPQSSEWFYTRQHEYVASFTPQSTLVFPSFPPTSLPVLQTCSLPPYLPPSQIDYDTAISPQRPNSASHSLAHLFLTCSVSLSIGLPQPGPPLAFGLRTASPLPNSRCQIKLAQRGEQDGGGNPRPRRK